jgi:hypothetical protein
MRRLIPLMVDTTLRHLLWMLEQWPELHLGVTLPTEAVSDVRHVALGELQGYLYYWIPRLSHEAHDLTVLDQDTPYPDGAPLPSRTLLCSLPRWCVGSPSCFGLNSYEYGKDAYALFV